MIWLLSFTLMASPCMAAQTNPEKLNYPTLTGAFYSKKKMFWTADNENASGLRTKLISLVDKSNLKGLNKKRFHIEILRAFDNGERPADIKTVENYFADAAITYCKDLVKNPDIEKWLSYDDVSKKYAPGEDEQLMRSLTAIDSDDDLAGFVGTLEPNDKDYKLMASSLAEQLQLAEKNLTYIKKIKTSLAYYRWIHHFKFDKYIVVNIASAKLRYYENNTQQMVMKIVAGDGPTETPRFAAYCNNITLYPYWHVPRSIALREILPFCKENEKDIADLDLQVLDRSGKVINPTTLNWQKFNENNFPYNFRHEPGCDNPLGLIKFNLTDPFDIYLHDTNLKPAFKSKKRFYSHGCVRLERPDHLANLFLKDKDKLNETFLTDCLENQRPQVKGITPIPVFVVYMPAESVEPGSITVYDDVYKLL